MNNINWYSIIISTLTPLTLGYLFYHRAVFGRYLKNPLGESTSSKTLYRILFIVVALILSFFLSFFMLNFNNDGLMQEGEFDTFGHGAWHGTVLVITTVAPVIVVTGYFSKTSWKVILINILYWLITLALMGGILDAMNHWENLVIP